jgi:plastocyanin
VLAAAPSHVPFYIAGGALVAWALLLAITGMRRPGFPGSVVAARVLMAVSVALVAATLTTAVVTASKEGQEKARPEGAAARPTAAAANVLRLAADPGGNLAFDKKEATVKAGAVTVRFTNDSPLPHNVTIAAGSRTVAKTKTFDHGVASVRANLRPGTYVFYCSVPGHREGGMEGRLTVR